MPAEALERGPGTPFWRSAGVARVTLLVACASVLALGVLASNEFPDEGFYLLAAENVRRGLVPYRDFPFFHMPGAAHFISLGLPFTGPSVRGMRWVFALVTLVAIAVAGRAVRRAAGPRAELVLLTLLACNPFALTALPTVASYTAPVALGFALLLTGWSLEKRREGELIAGLGFGVLVAVRVTYAPLLLGALLWCGFTRGRRVVPLFAGMALGFAVVSGRALGAFLHPGAAYTDIFQVQVERVQATPYLLHFKPGPNRRLVLSELAAHFWPAVVVLLLAVRRSRRALSGFTRAALIVVGAALCLHFLPKPTYVIYSAALALPLFAAVGAHAAQGTLSLRLVSLVAVAGLATQSVVLVRPGGSGLRWLSAAAHTLARGESGRAQTAHALARLTPPNSEVWTFDTTVAVEAERRVPPGFEMSFFGFYAGPLASAAPRRGLLNLERALEPLLTGRVAAVVASRQRSWNVFANAPREREALWHAICEHYEPRLHFDDEYYSELWLLLPRLPAAPTPECERLFATGDGRP